MALEVNEIGIRMRVIGDGEHEASSGGSGGEGGGEKENRAEIVDACVRRVLQILKASQAR